MELVSPLRFKQLLRASKDVVQLGVRKACACEETPENVEERVMRFTVSTGAVDRDMDMIDPRGWKLDHYRKNPVVLWGHRADLLPIGKTVELSNANGRLSATVKFLPGEGYGLASKRAAEIYALARDGYLAATSVGFRPLQWAFTDDKARGADSIFGGIDYHEQELVELSLVTVPSNPEALLEPVAPPLAEPAAASFASARAKRRRQFALIQAGG